MRRIAIHATEDSIVLVLDRRDANRVRTAVRSAYPFANDLSAYIDREMSLGDPTLRAAGVPAGALIDPDEIAACLEVISK